MKILGEAKAPVTSPARNLIDRIVEAELAKSAATEEVPALKVKKAKGTAPVAPAPGAVKRTK